MTPLWITEQEMLADDAARADVGAPTRNLDGYSAWRDRTDLDIQRALAFYGTYLVGQSSGFSDALSLPAVVAACDIEGIPADDRPEFTRRMLMIHSAAMEVSKARARQRKAASIG